MANYIERWQAARINRYTYGLVWLIIGLGCVQVIIRTGISTAGVGASSILAFIALIAFRIPIYQGGWRWLRYVTYRPQNRFIAGVIDYLIISIYLALVGFIPLIIFERLFNLSAGFIINHGLWVVVILIYWLLCIPLGLVVFMPATRGWLSLLLNYFVFAFGIFGIILGSSMYLPLSRSSVTHYLAKSGLIGAPILYWLIINSKVANKVPLRRISVQPFIRNWRAYLLIAAIIVAAWMTNGILGIRWPLKMHYLFAALEAGICEELLYRYYFTALLLPLFKGEKNIIFWVALMQGVMFGVWHVTNILAGAPVSGTIDQIIYAIAFGTLLGFIYLRTGRIWITMLFHAVFDYAGFLASSSELTAKTNWQNILIDAAIMLVIIVAIYVWTRFFWPGKKDYQWQEGSSYGNHSISNLLYKF